MTDKTDIKALREQAETAKVCGGMFAISGEQALSLLDQLEAERQRADRYHFVAMSALEAQAEISEQLGISEDECDGSPEQIHEKIEMLQTELAALKGDQVPVALIDERQGSGGFCLTQHGRRLSLKHGTELFTAPQKPVVDYFSSLVERGKIAAEKAMSKHPQPNYVLLKVAEEAGEVVQAGVHYAEGRMTWEDLEGEVIQLIAMLNRLMVEGDQVNGVRPPQEIESAGGIVTSDHSGDGDDKVGK